MSITRIAFVLLTVALGGCYRLDVDSGQLRCSSVGNRCPSSFYCAVDGFCWKNGQQPQPSTPATSAGHAGAATVSGGVSARSDHYRIVMSTAAGPAGASSSFKSRGGLVAATQAK